VRRVHALIAVTAIALGSGACGLGDKEALADRLTDAAGRLKASHGMTGTVTVRVAVVKSDDDPVVPGAPKILPATVEQVPIALDLEHDAAAVGLRDGDPGTAVLLFRGGDVYQRIAPKTTGVASAVLASAASNLQPLVDAYHGLTLNLTGDAATTSTTSTTIQHAGLKRASRIPREWIAFDFDELDKDDDTKRAGSFAINPTVLLRLVQGVLTGSIERRGDRYDANVNRDKAERHLSEDERKLLDKIFRANAVSKHTFPAHIWLDRDGSLRRFEVRLRQTLTNVDRADLTVTIDIATRGDDVRIPAPDRKATATVGSLGQLVTAVART
jgi:hypothetical protein